MVQTNLTSFFSAVTKKPSEQEKVKKTTDSPKDKQKVPPVKLSLSKSASPASSREDDNVSKKDSDKEIEKKKDYSAPAPSTPKTPLRELTPEERRAEAERWAAYYEYSMAPETTRRSSTKALALSRYHSDSEDEDQREERRKKAVSRLHIQCF